MAITTGRKAPDFSLFSDEKKPVTLSLLAGRPVVLLFFPGAYTSVCSTELNAVSNKLESFGADTVVLAISTDSPFVLAAFRKEHKLAFNLLSDHDGDVSTLYGARYARDFTPMKLDRISKRAAFVIDRYGTVRHAEVLDNAGLLPDLEFIAKTAAAL